MITVRGQIPVSRTGDDPCPPCVHSKRPRVYRHHAHMCFNMCRGAGTHGDVLNVHKEAFLNPRTGFPRFFSVPQHTQTDTQHTHQTHTTTTTTHTTQHTHTLTRRQRQRETEKEDRERDTREDETRQEGKRR